MSVLMGSESISQVFYAMTQYLAWAEELGIQLPLTGCYDDACHLSLFLMRRQHLSPRAMLLSAIDWVIDGFHYKNHKCVCVGKEKWHKRVSLCVVRLCERAAQGG